MSPFQALKTSMLSFPTLHCFKYKIIKNHGDEWNVIKKHNGWCFGKKIEKTLYTLIKNIFRKI